MNLQQKIEKAHWVCQRCGVRYGRRQTEISTWHVGTCEICGRPQAVTEFRDFGYGKAGKPKV